jgi:formylglycine-generating enzyme required for sulfatase activity
MTSPRLPYLAVRAAALGVASALPAQGYIAMTATQIPQTNAPAGVADFGLASRADGSWLLFVGQQASGLLVGTYTANNGVWQQRVSLLNPALRTGHQLAFDAVRGDSVMFGGKDALGNALSDTWVYANNQWSYRPTPSPSARYGHRMCFDAARGVVVLFGGKDDTQTLLADTWTWNGSAWAQASTSNAPAARLEHGMACDAYRQKVVLFGGEAATGLQNDVWDWDGTAWSQVVVPPVGGQPFGPDARSQHAMGYDAVAERVVVFGGNKASGTAANDAWAFDGANWVGLFGSTTLPSARARSQAVTAQNGRVQAFGGTANGAFLNDAWELGVPVLPRAFEYGTACIGSGGPLELRLVAGTQAAIGTTLAMRMTGMLSPFAAGVGFYGFSKTSVSGIPLPVDLAVVGIPGCNAYNSADNSMPLGLPSGTPFVTAWNVAIPNDSYFLGMDVYFQSLALEGFGYPRFATVTNGVETRLGNAVSVITSGPSASSGMTLISPGMFPMGSAAVGGTALPVHSVAITQPFWIGKFEVTQADYLAVMNNNPSYFQGNALRPVEQVSWPSAKSYCAALTAIEVAAGRVPVGYEYRLPTEAEWEYCCRAGTVTDWSVGSSISVSDANFAPGIGQTTAVGSYAANPWGLHDMHGNVFEWCLDTWNASSGYPGTPRTDPVLSGGPYPIIRGGCWQYGSSYCRSADRNHNGVSGGANNLVGFRVVLAPILVP